jgi:hypothetical protein
VLEQERQIWTEQDGQRLQVHLNSKAELFKKLLAAWRSPHVMWSRSCNLETVLARGGLGGVLGGRAALASYTIYPGGETNPVIWVPANLHAPEVPGHSRFPTCQLLGVDDKRVFWGAVPHPSTPGLAIVPPVMAALEMLACGDKRDRETATDLARAHGWL